MEDTLDRLMAELQRRAEEMPPKSYTTQLLAGGVTKMGAKIVEEAAEVVEAGEKLEHLCEQAESSDSKEDKESARDHLVYESCDLIYHLWVLLASQGISVDDLRNELARREGKSGLEEKRERTES